jgi:hypothetical protein
MIHPTEKDNARALGMAMGAMMLLKGRWHRPGGEVIAIRA